MDKEPVPQRDHASLEPTSPSQESGIAATPPPLVLDAGPRDPNLDKHPVPDNAPLGVPVQSDTKAIPPANAPSASTPVPNENSSTEAKAGFSDENSVLEYLETTGASEATAGQDDLKVTGVDASKALAKTDQERILKYIDNFKKVGAEKKLPPALLAAIASRESRGGTMLDEKGWGKSDPNGFGIMQVDKGSHEPDENDGPGGLGHIRQAADVLSSMLVEVKKKFPAWTEAQQLRGAVAAYNFNVDDVQTWEGLDKGTTGNDYSADIWARARYYASLEVFGGSGTVPEVKVPENQNASTEERKSVPKGKLIAQSVGKGGVNLTDDVDAILSRMLALKVITPEEAAQKEAIEAYVTRYQGMTMHGQPDGLISPGKKTEQNLINGVLEKPKDVGKGKQGAPPPGSKSPSKGAASKEGVKHRAYAEYVADQVYDAMFGGLTGIGTDEERITAYLRLLQNDPYRISLFKEAYKNKYKADVEDHLNSELSNFFLWGNQLDDALALLKAGNKAENHDGSTKGNSKGSSGGAGFPAVDRIMSVDDWRTQSPDPNDETEDSESGWSNCKIVAEKMVYRHLYEDLPDNFKRSQVVNDPNGKYEYVVGTVGAGQYLSVQREDKAYVKDIQPKTKKESILKPAKDADVAIDYLSGYISKGVPMVVGVDHTYNRSLKESDGKTSSKNTVGYNEGTTDHFVTIVGQGMDGGKRYFEFFDPGTRKKDNATSASNRLLEESPNVFRGDQPWKDKKGNTVKYTLSLVMLFQKDIKSYDEQVKQNLSDFKALNKAFGEKSGDFQYRNQ